MGSLSNRSKSNFKPISTKKLEPIDLVSMGSDVASSTIVDNYASEIRNFEPGKGSEWNKRPGTLLYAKAEVELFDGTTGTFDDIETDYGTAAIMFEDEGDIYSFVIKGGYIYQSINGSIYTRKPWFKYTEVYNFNQGDLGRNIESTILGTYTAYWPDDQEYDANILTPVDNVESNKFHQVGDYYVWLLNAKDLNTATKTPIVLVWPKGSQWKDAVTSRDKFSPYIDPLKGTPVTKQGSLNKYWLELAPEAIDTYTYTQAKGLNYASKYVGYRTPTFLPNNLNESVLSPETDGTDASNYLIKDGTETFNWTEDNIFTPIVVGSGPGVDSAFITKDLEKAYEDLEDLDYVYGTVDSDIKIINDILNKDNLKFEDIVNDDTVNKYINKNYLKSNKTFIKYKNDIIKNLQDIVRLRPTSLESKQLMSTTPPIFKTNHTTFKLNEDNPYKHEITNKDIDYPIDFKKTNFDLYEEVGITINDNENSRFIKTNITDEDLNKVSDTIIDKKEKVLSNTDTIYNLTGFMEPYFSDDNNFTYNKTNIINFLEDNEKIWNIKVFDNDFSWHTAGSSMGPPDYITNNYSEDTGIYKNKIIFKNTIKKDKITWIKGNVKDLYNTYKDDIQSLVEEMSKVTIKAVSSSSDNTISTFSTKDDGLSWDNQDNIMSFIDGKSISDIFESQAQWSNNNIFRTTVKDALYFSQYVRGYRSGTEERTENNYVNFRGNEFLTTGINPGYVWDKNFYRYKLPWVSSENQTFDDSNGYIDLLKLASDFLEKIKNIKDDINITLSSDILITTTIANTPFRGISTVPDDYKSPYNNDEFLSKFVDNKITGQYVDITVSMLDFMNVYEGDELKYNELDEIQGASFVKDKEWRVDSAKNGGLHWTRYYGQYDLNQYSATPYYKNPDGATVKSKTLYSELDWFNKNKPNIVSFKYPLTKIETKGGNKPYIDLRSKIIVNINDINFFESGYINSTLTLSNNEISKLDYSDLIIQHIKDIDRETFKDEIINNRNVHVELILEQKDTSIDEWVTFNQQGFKRNALTDMFISLYTKYQEDIYINQEDGTQILAPYGLINLDNENIIKYSLTITNKSTKQIEGDMYSGIDNVYMTIDFDYNQPLLTSSVSIVENAKNDKSSMKGIAAQQFFYDSATVGTEEWQSPRTRIIPIMKGDTYGEKSQNTGLYNIGTTANYNEGDGVISFQKVIAGSDIAEIDPVSMFEDIFSIDKLIADKPLWIKGGNISDIEPDTGLAKGFKIGPSDDLLINETSEAFLLIFNLTIPLKSDIWLTQGDIVNNPNYIGDDASGGEEVTTPSWEIKEGDLAIKQSSFTSLVSNYVKTRIVEVVSQESLSDEGLSAKRSNTDFVDIGIFENKLVVAKEGNIYLSQTNYPFIWDSIVENVPTHMGKIFRVLEFQGTITVFFERGYATFSPQQTTGENIVYNVPENVTELPAIFSKHSIAVGAGFIDVLTIDGVKRIRQYNQTVTGLPLLTHTNLSSSIKSKLLRDMEKVPTMFEDGVEGISRMFTIREKTYILLQVRDKSPDYENGYNDTFKMYIFDANKDLVLTKSSQRWYTWESPHFDLLQLEEFTNIDGEISIYMFRKNFEILKLGYKQKKNNLYVDGYLDRAYIIDPILPKATATSDQSYADLLYEYENGLTEFYAGEKIKSLILTNPLGSENIYDMKWKSYAIALNNFGFEQKYYHKHYLLNSQTGQFVDENVSKDIYSVKKIVHTNSDEDIYKVEYLEDEEFDMTQLQSVNEADLKMVLDVTPMYTTEQIDKTDINVEDKIDIGAARASEFKIKIIHTDNKPFTFKKFKVIFKEKKHK